VVGYFFEDPFKQRFCLLPEFESSIEIFLNLPETGVVLSGQFDLVVGGVVGCGISAIEVMGDGWLFLISETEPQTPFVLLIAFEQSIEHDFPFLPHTLGDLLVAAH